MLQLNGAVRTLIVWFTLLLTWSAYVMWCYGTPILKYILSESGLFAFYNALSTATPGLMPPGLITVLFLLIVLAIGGLLSTLTLVGWRLFVKVYVLMVLAIGGLLSTLTLAGWSLFVKTPVQWLRVRTGHVHTDSDAALK